MKTTLYTQRDADKMLVSAWQDLIEAAELIDEMKKQVYKFRIWFP